MIEKEFNDRIYTKSTAKREKYTIFMLQNIGLFPLLDGSPDKPGGLSIQLCKSEKKEFYIRYSS